ncbi:MAG TPA: cytochrome c [Candidatus Acidoferrales bacterium]|nr:cytochrome c [Candidatus Acidoferrales bacterium]
MRRVGIRATAGFLFMVATLGMLVVREVWWAQAQPTSSAPLAAKLLAERGSPADLEIGGNLEVMPHRATWYLTREDLLGLRQASFTVSDDPNFLGPTRVSGVPLEDLVRDVGAPAGDMVVAICKDKYQTNYSRDYLAQHHPLLVLEINGKPPSGWPRDSSRHEFDLGLGPYMITHPNFTPAFRVLAHNDEAQIPWGVVRLEFRNQEQVFGAIAPSGPLAKDRTVEAGYRIAQQNCFRCHNAGDEGGKKSGVTWAVLSAVAAGSPDFFAKYVSDPKSKSPQSQMPANPEYDHLTLDALTAYFRSFQQPGSP